MANSFLDDIKQELIECYAVPKMLLDYIEARVEEYVQDNTDTNEWERRISELEEKLEDQD